MLSLLNQHIQRVAMKRAEEMIKPILPWLLKGKGKILDFGGGFGHVGFLASKQSKRHVEYLDIRKYPFMSPEVDVKVFDGKVIPHPDDEFDTSLVIFVLHHVPQPSKSLKEIMRVSKREVIVCEDLLKSKKEIVIEAIKDTIVNGFLPHMTMQYRIESDWEKMFTKLGLKIKDKTYFRTHNIFDFEHVAWFLSVE